MKFDSIILDIDGTIWNTTEVVADAWNKAIDINFPQVKHVTAEVLQQQFGKTMDVIADNLFTILSKSEKEKLLKECCKYEHEYLEKNTKHLTYEGVVEGIKQLATILPVFIVSNCQNGYIELVIEMNNIESYIKDFECYGKTGLGKADNIRLICNRNNLKNPVYVGDTKGDEEACKSAEVSFIWASYGFGKADEYFAEIKSFCDLLNIIE